MKKSEINVPAKINKNTLNVTLKNHNKATNKAVIPHTIHTFWLKVREAFLRAGISWFINNSIKASYCN